MVSSSSRSHGWLRTDRRRLFFEPLESREVLSHFTVSPVIVSPAAQFAVYRLNQIRNDPQAYDDTIGQSTLLDGVAARPPFAVNDDLYRSSSFKSQELAHFDYFCHQSPPSSGPFRCGAPLWDPADAPTGLWPNELTRYGEQGNPDNGTPPPFYQLDSSFPDENNFLESLAAGNASAESTLAQLIVDAGTNPPGHRFHLLSIDPISQGFDFRVFDREIGIGHAFDVTATYDNYWVFHATRQETSDVFLTGVVFDDTNGNDVYDTNEGRGGETVTANGLSTLTNSEGGWSIEVAPGPYSVTHSGISVEVEVQAFDKNAEWQTTKTGNREIDFIAGVKAFLDFAPVSTAGGGPQSLNAADTFNRDEFGTAVALDGDLAVVGARLGEGSPATNNSGLAYVFERAGGLWSEVAQLVASDAASTDYFGAAVAIDGDTIVIGAPPADDAFVNSGAAYIYQQDQGGSGHWGQVAKLVNPTPANQDQFGNSVSIRGDTIAVGASLDDDPARPGSNHGSVSLFGRDVGGVDSWGRITTIFNALSPTVSDKFGQSVSLSGDTLAVGAHHAGTSNQGAVFVHERNQGGADAWGEVLWIDNPESNSGDQFGWSVSLDNDTLAVGNPFDDTPITGSGKNAGSTFVFQRDNGGPDNWGQVQKLIPDATVDRDMDEANDRFGWSVSVAGDRLVVGAPFTNATFGSDGVVYEFGRNVGGTDNWGGTSVTQPANIGPGDRFGSSVAASGLLAVFGAPKDDAPGIDMGSAYFPSPVAAMGPIAMAVTPLGAPLGVNDPIRSAQSMLSDIDTDIVSLSRAVVFRGDSFDWRVARKSMQKFTPMHEDLKLEGARYHDLPYRLSIRDLTTASGKIVDADIVDDVLSNWR